MEELSETMTITPMLDSIKLKAKKKTPCIEKIRRTKEQVAELYNDLQNKAKMLEKLQKSLNVDEFRKTFGEGISKLTPEEKQMYQDFCASLEMRGKSFEEIKKILDLPIADWSIANLKTLKSTMGLLQIHQVMKVDEFKKFWNILDPRWTTEDLKIRQKIIMTLKLQGDLVDEIRKIMNDQCLNWSKIGKN